MRTQIRLSEEAAAAVKRLARERSRSMASVIRAAVDQYLERESSETLDERWRRSLAAVGGFHSGVASLSAAHDDEFAACASE